MIIIDIPAAPNFSATIRLAAIAAIRGKANGTQTRPEIKNVV